MGACCGLSSWFVGLKIGHLIFLLSLKQVPHWNAIRVLPWAWVIPILMMTVETWIKPRLRRSHVKLVSGRLDAVWCLVDP